ncbi:MAG TPA: hypothetical protein VFI31_09305 [Pirellulales bacterium]|nr:hypothetical protein [Pirellulales bacterium]
MRRGCQFSLKWVLALPVFAGAVLAAMTGRPLWLCVPGLRLLLVAWVGLLGVAVAQGGRFARAFGIAAFLPAALAAGIAVRPIFYPRVNMPPSDVHGQLMRTFNRDLPYVDFKFTTGFLLATSVLCGVAGQGLAWLIANPSIEAASNEGRRNES